MIPAARFARPTTQKCLQLLQRMCPHAATISRSQPTRWPVAAAAAAAGQQQQQQQGAATTTGSNSQLMGDGGVVETLRQLESAIGPLSQHPMVPPPQPRVIVISGPSGVGKDAVIRRLQEQRPDLYFVVTATSRPMRPGEVEGRDYFFVDKAKFESWIAAGQLLEHALVYGEWKGIPRQQVDAALARGCDVVLRIDVQGAATVRQLMPDNLLSVFIVAESEAALVQRLVSRKTEPMDKMLTRVQTARQETQQIGQFDYVVVNRDGQLDECVAQLCAIIDAEKLRTSPSTSRPSSQQQQPPSAPS